MWLYVCMRMYAFGETCLTIMLKHVVSFLRANGVEDEHAGD